MSGGDHRELAAIPLDDAGRARCTRIVGSVFKYFEEWTAELLAFAVAELKRRDERPEAGAAQLRRA